MCQTFDVLSGVTYPLNLIATGDFVNTNELCNKTNTQTHTQTRILKYFFLYIGFILTCNKCKYRQDHENSPLRHNNFIIYLLFIFYSLTL